MMNQRQQCAATILAAVMLGGCGSDDSDGSGEAEATSDGVDSLAGESGDSSSSQVEDDGTGDESGGASLDLEALVNCDDPDFAVAQPLTGPGFDPQTGDFIGGPQEAYFVHTTQILVNPDRVEQFDALVGPVIEQLVRSEGLLGFGFASEPNCGSQRTMGLWTSEEAMMAFVYSGAHLDAIAASADVSIAGRTISFELPADGMPLTWDLAMDRIAEVSPFGGY